MAITLPSMVAPNELIQSAWGNGVVNALSELDDEKVDNNANGEITGQLTLNHPSSGTSLVLKAGDEIPRLRWQSQAGTDLASMIASASALTLDTQSNNPFNINAPTVIETGSGSAVLNLKAVTETPRLTLESVAGTDLLWLTAGVATSFIDTFDDLQIRTNGSNALFVDGGTQNVTLGAGLTITGTLDHNGSTIGFFGVTPTARSTGWGAPTGTATKTTFATGSVTTAQLAERVKAIIDYLMLRGDFGT